MLKELPNWKTLTPDEARPFGKIRLIVADLDGTLVRQGSSDIYNVIARLRSSLAHPRYNVAFTIATGRALAGVAKLVSKVGLTSGIPMVLYNGSVVVKNTSTQVVFQAVIPNKIVQKILTKLKGSAVTILMYHFSDVTRTFFSSLNDIETVFGWSNINYFETEFNNIRVQWHSDWCKVPAYDASAIIVLAKDEETLANAQEEMGHFPEVTITLSGERHIEIRPQGSNKAHGLMVAANTLGISREEILAIGDNDNDAEMLHWAGISVCVGHASSMALKNSDFQCKYNVEKGAVEVLRIVRNARRYFFKPQYSIKGASYE